jgi:hypothetical protein
LLTAPGQIQRVSPNWPTLFKKLSNGESFGFINVVAYGYHSFQLPSYRDHDVYVEGMSPSNFAQAYTAARRTAELDILQSLINGLSAVTTPVWMVTLVNNQDLWWKDQKAVRKHYEAGEYSAKIAEIERALGSRSFQHELLPVSFAMTNLAAADGTPFASTNAGYDLPTHLRYLQSMFSHVHTLIGQGRKR